MQEGVSVQDGESDDRPSDIGAGCSYSNCSCQVSCLRVGVVGGHFRQSFKWRTSGSCCMARARLPNGIPASELVDGDGDIPTDAVVGRKIMLTSK